jgi:hypothetical protein
MRPMREPLVLSPLLGCLLLGCAVDPLDAPDTTIEALEPGDGTAGGCPVWGCGSNTSKTHGIPFTTASELGLPNDAGFSIVRFEQFDGAEWRAYRPDVEMASLSARDLVTGALVLEGVQLVGARFELYHSRTHLFYYLHVEWSEMMPLWAQPDPTTSAQTRTYRLKWEFKPGQQTPAMNPEDICGPNPDSTAGGGPMADFYAVLFEDDRIDVDALTALRERPDWFNIGCAGHALAKQHLLGHTKAAGLITGTSTTLAQRTANLKMITADYCGNGHPMTVPGEPLRWRDEYGWYDTVTGGTVEARWTEAGAVCLNTPRVDFNFTTVPLDEQTFPTGVAAIMPLWCPTVPAPCTNATTTDLDGAHLVSVNL